MTENIDHGDVNNGFELSNELVSNHSTKDRCEVAQHCKGVVDDGGLVLSEVELLMQVYAKDGFHTVV